MKCNICGCTLVHDYDDEWGSFGPLTCPNDECGDEQIEELEGDIL